MKPLLNMSYQNHLLTTSTDDLTLCVISDMIRVSMCYAFTTCVTQLFVLLLLLVVVVVGFEGGFGGEGRLNCANSASINLQTTMISYFIKRSEIVLAFFFKIILQRLVYLHIIIGVHS